mgnify:CR=1 FL=1
MHNCKTAHPKKSHRRRNRALRRLLEPLHTPTGWGSSEPGPAPEGTGVLQKSISTVRDLFSAPSGSPAPERVTSGGRVELYPASMLRRLSAVVKRPFVRQAPGR